MKAKIVNFDSEHSPEIITIRTQVFVKEQGIDSAIDFDGLDESAIHALVVLQGNAIGTGRMLDDGHIGRIAVLKEYRSRGVGALILKSIIDEAKKQGFKRVYLGSQMPAVGFYIKLGFKTYGETFIDAGLEHIEMEQYL